MSDEKLAENLASGFALKDGVSRRSWTYEMLFDGFKNGFLAGLKAEREKSKKLVETLRIYTKIDGFSGPAIEALKEYKKESE